MKRICISCLGVMLCLPFVWMGVQAKGTNISIEITEKNPQYHNTHLKIENSNGFLVPDAVLYMKDKGVYLPVGRSLDDGRIDFYLVEGDSEDIMIQCQGYAAVIQRLTRSKDVDETITICLHRNGPYQDYQEEKIHIGGLSGHEANENFAFTIGRSGMGNQNPIPGDLRFIAMAWSVKDAQGDFVIRPHAIASYGQNMNLRKPGTYTLCIAFQQQRYERGAWQDVGNETLHLSPFRIAAETVDKPSGGKTQPSHIERITKTTYGSGNYGISKTNESNKESKKGSENGVQESEPYSPFKGEDTPSPIILNEVSNNAKRNWWWLFILVLIGITGGGIYYYRKRKKAEEEEV